MKIRMNALCRPIRGARRPVREGRAAAVLAVLAALWGLGGAAPEARAQRVEEPRQPLIIDVGAFNLSLSTRMGDGGLASQFSWNLTENKEESMTFYYPQDRYLSNMLFHLYNVINFSDEGYIGLDGERRERTWERLGVTTDWAQERRRYRPPEIVVDGVLITPPYQWETDPDAEAALVASFEDIHRNRDVGYGGFRSKVNLYAFDNPNHDDYLIWEETRVFTGESLLAREKNDGDLERSDFLPNQTVRVWWGFTAGFSPTKGGEGESLGFYGFEGEDDKDGWFRRPSLLDPPGGRDELVVGYYWDAMTTQTRPYELVAADGTSVGVSDDDSGDPSRVNGSLTATQVPGFTILYASESPVNFGVDDPGQPWAAPHANIVDNFFGQRFNFAMRDVYAGLSGSRFPGPASTPEKGSMRVLTVGPYDLTMERDAQNNLVRADSFKVVYAIGVGDAGFEVADSLGRAWLRGEITDAEKNAFIQIGQDSLFQALDRANWAWANDLRVPSPPPPPDVEVTSGADQNIVSWSYPEERYFQDPDTGVDDFYAWRVYRKRGGFWVNDPDDNYNGAQWELVHETTSRGQTTFEDGDVERGIPYFYAVTAVDDGSQNTFGLNPGEKLESSRFANRSRLPVVPFKPGFDVSDQVRVVPNPWTPAAGPDLNFGNTSQLLFANLPFEATLSVYTETGELIRTFDHYGTADERWDQRTDGNQVIASGLYILAVTEARDRDGNALPDQFVKFIIIR